MAGSTIKLPGLGPTKKSTAYMLGGAAVLVGVVAWYRSRALGGAGAAEEAAGAAAGSEVNPATGYPYGTDADYAALGQMGTAGGGYGYYGGDGSNTSGGTTTAGFTTNGQWSQAAEDYLVNTVHSGQNADVIGNALGKYITGAPLSADQEQIITQAIAFIGYPPVNGPTGYPPSFRTAATPATPPAAKPPAGKSLPAPGGLKATGITRTSARVDWNPVKGAKAYVPFIVIDPPGGATPTGVRQGTFSATEFTPQRLRPGTRYRVDVHAMGTDNVLGTRARTYFTTKK